MKKNQFESQHEIDVTYKARLENIKNPSWQVILVVFLIAVGVWLVIGFLPWWFEHGAPWTLSLGLPPGTSGTFGDSFGFVNSLFSGLALAGLVIAIHLQRLELAEQRKQLIMQEWSQVRSAVEQRELEKNTLAQSRLQFNSVLLIALQGVQDFASVESDVAVEGEATRAKFLREMVSSIRFAVIAKSLSESSVDEYGNFLSKEMNSWMDLIQIVHYCDNILLSINALITQNTNDFRIFKAKEFKDINPKQYSLFVDMLVKQRDEFERALSRINDDPDLLKAFLSGRTYDTEFEEHHNKFHILINLERSLKELKCRVLKRLEEKSQRFSS
jgi:hypothetical protein